MSCIEDIKENRKKKKKKVVIKKKVEKFAKKAYQLLASRLPQKNSLNNI